jgi:hypothetical protein
MAWSSYLLDPAGAADAAREAVVESTRIGSSYYLGSAYSSLALACSELGNVDESFRAWAEALEKMLDAGAKSNALVTLSRMSDAMFEVAPTMAVTLAAGAARHPGPGADGTWHDPRFESTKRRALPYLDADQFEVAWREGASLSIDALVRLARSAVDELIPEPA